MTQALQDRFDGLRSALVGELITSVDEGYDAARRVWNADIDRRPAVVVRCGSAEDVAAAITFAVDQHLEVAVRGGAHSMSGASTVDEGLVIDLSRLNSVSVDPQERLARVGGGALLADLDAATQQHGLAVPAGVVSHTGVGGLTLGGGMGWLTRRAGLTIDHLRSAEVVTADGQIRRVSAQEHPDLFWALRGGGGNFGVVTEFEFDLCEAGPMVQVGLMFWGLEQGREVLRLAREVMATLSLDLNIIIAGMNSPAAPFVPQEHHGRPGFAFVVVGFGSAEDHAAFFDGLLRQLPPVWEFASPMPYVGLQQMLDESNAWGFHNYEKGMYVEELTDEVIEVVVEHLPRKTSPLSLVLFYRLDGAFSQVPEEATAFSGARSPRYAMFNVAVCPTPDVLATDRAWVRSLWEAMRPYAPEFGTYVNSITEVEDERVQIAFGPQKYERLAQVKAEFDPNNVFRRNPNIKPA